MKVLCPQCERLLPLERFRVEGRALIITCGKCGHDTRVEGGEAPVAAVATTPPPPRVSLASAEGASNVVMLRTAAHDAVTRAAQAVDAPFAIPDGLCPKCLARRVESEACPHCGIRFEMFTEVSVLPPKYLRDDWVTLLGDWGNEQRHMQFRRKAQQADSLAAIGRLYRLRQAHFPEDPIAAEALTDVLRLASVPMGLPREEAQQGGSRQLVLLVVSVLGLGFAALLWRMVFSAGS